MLAKARSASKSWNFIGRYFVSGAKVVVTKRVDRFFGESSIIDLQYRHLFAYRPYYASHSAITRAPEAIKEIYADPAKKLLSSVSGVLRSRI